jgi:hypothetical protein
MDNNGMHAKLDLRVLISNYDLRIGSVNGGVILLSK